MVFGAYLRVAEFFFQACGECGPNGLNHRVDSDNDAQLKFWSPRNPQQLEVFPMTELDGRARILSASDLREIRGCAEMKLKWRPRSLEQTVP